MTKMDDMKMDFLLHIQTNQYDIAYEISKEILEINPHDALIQKFALFLNQYKGKIKQMESQMTEKIPTIIQEDTNPTYDSDMDSNYSISQSEDSSDGQQHFQKPQLAVPKAKQINKQKPKVLTTKMSSSNLKKK